MMMIEKIRPVSFQMDGETKRAVFVSAECDARENVISRLTLSHGPANE